MIARGGRADRGTSLLEVVVTVSLLTVVTLAFYSVVDSSAKTEREAAVLGEARGEADRVFEVVAGDLRHASLATVTLPAPGASAGGAKFRRIVGFVEGADGVPVAVLAASETEYRVDAQGALLREEGGRAIVVARRVTRFEVARAGATAAFGITVEVARGERPTYTGSTNGDVLVASD